MVSTLTWVYFYTDSVHSETLFHTSLSCSTHRRSCLQGRAPSSQDSKKKRRKHNPRLRLSGSDETVTWRCASILGGDNCVGRHFIQSTSASRRNCHLSRSRQPGIDRIHIFKILQEALLRGHCAPSLRQSSGLFRHTGRLRSKARSASRALSPGGDADQGGMHLF